MAIQFPQGFQINSVEPVDSRIAVTSRLDQSTFTAYVGLIVYDITESKVYFLNDVTDPSLEASWTEVGSSSGTVTKEEVDNAIGVSPTGAPDNFYNEQGDFVQVTGANFLARLTETVDSTTNLVTEYGLVDDSDPANFVAYSFRRYLVNGIYFLRRTQISNDATPLLDYGYVLQTQAEITALQALDRADQLTYLQGLTYGGPSVVTT